MRMWKTMATLSTLAAVALACGGGDDAAPEETPEPEKTAAAPSNSAAALPFDFPAAKPPGPAGRFLLVPSRESLDKATPESSTMIYYGATLVEPGPSESRVQSLAGTDFSMPNALMISIRTDEKAQVGDVLLGHWESGSGMRRAVVTGGTPDAPVVHYLVDSIDGPGKADEDTFKTNRFNRLTGPAQVGTTVACKDGSDMKHGVMTAIREGRLIMSGFASRVNAYDAKDCVAIPPKAEFAAGDNVHVPVLGTYRMGTVSSVDSTLLRVYVKYEFGGEEKLEGFPMLDVASSLDKFGVDPAVGSAKVRGAPRTGPKVRSPDTRPRRSKSSRPSGE